MPFLHSESGTQFLAIRLRGAGAAQLDPRGWSVVPGHRALRCSVRRRGGASYVILGIDTAQAAPGDALRVDLALLRATLGDALDERTRVDDVELRVPQAREERSADLVVDFGNTTSMVTAVRHDAPGAEAFESLELADRFLPDADEHMEIRRDRIVPSCVLFEQAAAGEASAENPIVSIGATARQRAAALGASARQYLAAPKRMLGDRGPAEFEDLSGRALPPLWPRLPWLACHAPALYLRELLLAAWEALNRPSATPQPYWRVRDVHFAAPATFTQVEVDTLIECAHLGLHLAGMDAEPRIICDESTAVARFFLHDQAEYHEHSEGLAAFRGVIRQNRRQGVRGRDSGDRLRVMVIDVGGGSTDVSIADYVWDAEQRCIATELVHVDGAVVGGDDFSEQIIRGLARRIAEEAACPDLRRFDMSLTSAGTRHLVSRALLDALHRFSDEIKARAGRAAGGAEAVEPLAIRLDDLFLDAGDATLREDPFDLLDAPPYFLRGRFYDAGGLREMLVDPNEAAAWGETRRFTLLLDHWLALEARLLPDVLIVSGMSARLPFLGPRIQAELRRGGPKVVLLHEYEPYIKALERVRDLDKACVSLGMAMLVASGYAHVRVRSSARPARAERAEATDGATAFRPFPRNVYIRGIDRRVFRHEDVSEAHPTSEREATWPSGLHEALVECSFGEADDAPRTPVARLRWVGRRLRPPQVVRFRRTYGAGDVLEVVDPIEDGKPVLEMTQLGDAREFFLTAGVRLG